MKYCFYNVFVWCRKFCISLNKFSYITKKINQTIYMWTIPCIRTLRLRSYLLSHRPPILCHSSQTNKRHFTSPKLLWHWHGACVSCVCTRPLHVSELDTTFVCLSRHGMWYTYPLLSSRRETSTRSCDKCLLNPNLQVDVLLNFFLFFYKRSFINFKIVTSR